MIGKTNIAVILLNFNSEKDLFISTVQLKKQININLITIIVDNASSAISVEKVKEWSKLYKDNSFSASSNELFELTKDNILNKNNYKTFFIYNNENNGYSAGNNIGIKLADYLNVDTVMIANPDMRFENVNYMFELSKTLFSDQKCVVAASKIIGLDGKDQSPLREASFYEELMWPRHLFPSIFKSTSFILPYEKNKIITVPKVMGCCLMLQMDFLREINYFDENIFLYAEEPILSAQVKQKNGKIVFTPKIEAIHAHIKSEKGNSSKRMFLFIKSRKYYLQKYSNYKKLQLLLLNISYGVLYSLHYLKYTIERLSNAK